MNKIDQLRDLIETYGEFTIPSKTLNITIKKNYIIFKYHTQVEYKEYNELSSYRLNTFIQTIRMYHQYDIDPNRMLFYNTLTYLFILSYICLFVYVLTTLSVINLIYYIASIFLVKYTIGSYIMGFINAVLIKSHEKQLYKK